MEHHRRNPATLSEEKNMRMRIRAALSSLAALAALTTACTSSPESSNDSQPIGQNVQSVAQCEGYSNEPRNPAIKAPAVAPEVREQERTIDVLKPSNICDYSIKVEVKDGKRHVSCQPFVGHKELSIPSANETRTHAGFAGDWTVLDFGYFARINWDTHGAHAIIVNNSAWAYVDGPGSNTNRITPISLASLLYDAEWGPVLKIDVCGWGA